MSIDSPLNSYLNSVKQLTGADTASLYLLDDFMGQSPLLFHVGQMAQVPEMENHQQVMVLSTDALNQQQATIHQGSANSFDASLTVKFIQNIGIYPLGTIVETHNGEVGIVVENNPTHRLRPRIELLLDKKTTSGKRTFH